MTALTAAPPLAMPCQIGWAALVLTFSTLGLVALLATATARTCGGVPLTTAGILLPGAAAPA